MAFSAASCTESKRGVSQVDTLTLVHTGVVEFDLAVVVIFGIGAADLDSNVVLVAVVAKSVVSGNLEDNATHS